ncbi:hypothetical protein ACLMJK_003701 [Lecanora helva]
MASVPVNPKPMLQSLVNEPVIVRLKWGQTEYHGRLISVDSYMNIQLSNTEEFIDGKGTGTLGQVLISPKLDAIGATFTSRSSREQHADGCVLQMQ